MKSVIIAAILAGTFASASMAEPFARPAVIGKTEYNLETNAWAANLGTQFALGDLTLSPLVKATYNAANKFDFIGYEVTGAVSLSEGMTAYLTVNATDKMDYTDAVAGVSFKF